MLWPMTVPSRTLSAAASVVPCRLQSCDCRSEIVKRSDPKRFKMLLSVGSRPDIRLARAVPGARQRLRKTHPHWGRVLHSRYDPPHAATDNKAPHRLVKTADGL